MKDSFKQWLQEATDLIKNQANQIGSGAKEKSEQLIERWLQIFPKLEALGFETTSFSLGVAISPLLEVELVGKHADFHGQKLEEAVRRYAGNTTMLSVLNTIRTTYKLHEKTGTPLKSPLILKIRVKLSPEIRVYLGEPLIE